MLFVGAIGLCYGFEVFLVHPDWQRAFYATLLPTFDHRAMRGSVFAAVGMLGATVMPHVIYLHSALVQPRLSELAPPPGSPKPGLLRKYLHFELIDVFVAMNGAWLIHSAMVLRFPIFLRRFLTVIPALIVIGMGRDPLHVLNDSQVLLSFTLPFALIPLLLLVQRESVMRDFKSALRTRVAGWAVASIIVVLNAVLLVQMVTT